jgi:hypothetical protein
VNVVCDLCRSIDAVAQRLIGIAHHRQEELYRQQTACCKLFFTALCGLVLRTRRGAASLAGYGPNDFRE